MYFELLVMAWRNLMRRKRRTNITAVSIGFAVFLAVTFTGMGDDSYKNMINTSVKLGFGHVTVQASDFHLRPTADKYLRDVNKLYEEIVGQPGIEHAATRIITGGLVASAHKQVGGMLMGINVAQETPDINLFQQAIVAGRWLAPEDSRVAIIGVGMADKLNINLGKKLVYTITDVDGEIVSDVVRVVGIFDTGMLELDQGQVLLPLRFLQHTLNYKNDQATLIGIYIEDHREAEQIRDSLNESIIVPDGEILSWQQSQSELAGMINVDRGSNQILQGLVGLLVAAGIMNTMLMSVLERTKEFGVLLAIGMSPIKLVYLVLWESIWLGLLGLMLGIMICIPWYYYMDRVGIDFSQLMGENASVAGVAIDPVIHLKLYPETVTTILVGVFLFTLLASLYPAIRAGRTLPLEALKEL